MSTEGLRQHLGKSLVEGQRRKEIQDIDRAKTNQNFQHWNKALEAFALGWRKPKSRYPVIISPDSLISTPEKLQELARTAETPRVINKTYTTMRGIPDDSHIQADGKPEEVQVGEVSWRELTEITRRTECEDFLFVLLDGKIRHTVMVKSLKAHNNVAEQQDLSKNQDDKSGMSPCDVQTA